MRRLALITVVTIAAGCSPATAPPSEETRSSGGSSVSERGDAPAGTETGATDTPRCDLEVLRVLSEERFRGYPSSPASQARVEAMSPDEYQMWIAESHGASYVECVYLVRVGEARYHFTESLDSTWERRPEGVCETQRAEVAAHIRTVTRECTELHRGAYYGSDLTPAD